jgi:hypothetical protein
LNHTTLKSESLAKPGFALRSSIERSLGETAIAVFLARFSHLEKQGKRSVGNALDHEV